MDMHCGITNFHRSFFISTFLGVYFDQRSQYIINLSFLKSFLVVKKTIM